MPMYVCTRDRLRKVWWTSRTNKTQLVTDCNYNEFTEISIAACCYSLSPLNLHPFSCDSFPHFLINISSLFFSLHCCVHFSLCVCVCLTHTHPCQKFMTEPLHLSHFAGMVIFQSKGSKLSDWLLCDWIWMFSIQNCK